jgi:CubicO group peptidase (beta-lactamase class C family)
MQDISGFGRSCQRKKLLIKIGYCIPLLLLLNIHGRAQEQQLNGIIQEADVPGIQLIYCKQDQIKSFNEGVIKEGSEKKINGNTIFQAASLSKSVFAYAVLRLWDRGLIDLDSPLLNYTGNYPRFDPHDQRYKKITARMVLRHSTGLPNWGNDSSAALLFTPDSCFSYSGEGYLFLQKALEKKLQKPLNKIMQEEVFSPLKMENSSYVWMDKFEANASMDHQTPAEIARYENANAAYSLLTNTTDYNIFLRALMTGRGLKESTHHMMLEKASPANRFGQPVNDSDPYIDWGLGVGLQHNEKGDAFWHWGDNGDYKCFYIAFPARGESLIYFTHSRNGLNITEEILNLFFGPQTCWAIKWLGYGYQSPLVMKTFRAALLDRGFDQAMAIYHEKKMKDTAYMLPEGDLNTLGYTLLNKGKNKEALEIFKLNTSLYPKSWNVYDSEGEAYQALGDRVQAINDYKRSLELNPGNDNAVEHLKLLGKNNGK